MSSEIVANNDLLAGALSVAGKRDELRSMIFDALRQSEIEAENPAIFREEVRWPLILSLLSEVKTHRVVLENGLVFDVGPDSRIEKALLLSTVPHPDHVWEPQTTKLLMALAAGACNVIVGGAYIGDQTLFLARTLANSMPVGIVHAFEPMTKSFDRLLHHIRINQVSNVVAHRLGLWNRSEVALRMTGHLGLASSVAVEDQLDPFDEVTQSISIDDYVASHQLSSVELLMLDTEGGEENALLGASNTISRDSPHIVFEIHRHFVDWTEGLEKTAIVTFLTSQDYEVFAVRDFHNNYPMAGQSIEIIPIANVYLDGPPHGFNVLATKDRSLVSRLGLRIVKDVSPKLLLEKDPSLHLPLPANT